MDRDLGAGEVEMFFGREDGSCEEVPVFETSTLSGLDLRGLCCMVLPVKRGSLLLGGGVLELFEDRTRCSGSLSLGASRRGLRSTLSLLTCMLGAVVSCSPGRHVLSSSDSRLGDLGPGHHHRRYAKHT